MRALFPRLIDAEARAGSVIRAFRREQGTAQADGVFRSFPQWTRRADRRVDEGCPKRVRAVRLECHPHRRSATASSSRSRASRRFARVPFPRCSGVCGRRSRTTDRRGAIQHSARRSAISPLPPSSLRFRVSAVGHDLQGTGFVVPSAEGLSITAGAWISSKWPHRAPGRSGTAPRLSRRRARSGRARQNRCRPRQRCARRLDEDSRHPRRADHDAHVRWNRSSPQQEVGHGELMRRIDAGLADHRGLFISAAGFRGIGIPDSIADAPPHGHGNSSFRARVICHPPPRHSDAGRYLLE